MGLFLTLGIWQIDQQTLASKWQPALKRVELGCATLPAVRAWKGSSGGMSLIFPWKLGDSSTQHCQPCDAGACKWSLFPWMSFRLQSPLWHLHPLGTKPSVSLGATQTSLGKNLLNSGREALIRLQWLQKKKKKLEFGLSVCFYPISFNNNKKMAYIRDTANCSWEEQK